MQDISGSGMMKCAAQKCHLFDQTLLISCQHCLNHGKQINYPQSKCFTHHKGCQVVICSGTHCIIRVLCIFLRETSQRKKVFNKHCITISLHFLLFLFMICPFYGHDLSWFPYWGHVAQPYTKKIHLNLGVWRVLLHSP